MISSRSISSFIPMVGSIYYGIARSSGLNFWESFLYSVAGSFVWEIAGETTNPSINDMITTPIGGTFLGEPFFRMASLLLEDSDGKARFLARARRSGHLTPDGIQSPGLRRQVRRRVPEPQARHFHALAGGGNDLIEQQERLVRRSKRLEPWQTSHLVTVSLASQATVTRAHSIILTFMSPRSPPMHWKASTLAGFFWGTTYAFGRIHAGDMGTLRKLRLHLPTSIPCFEYGPVAGNNLANVVIADCGTPRDGPRWGRLWSSRQYRAHG